MLELDNYKKWFDKRGYDTSELSNNELKFIINNMNASLNKSGELHLEGNCMVNNQQKLWELFNLIGTMR